MGRSTGIYTVFLIAGVIKRNKQQKTNQTQKSKQEPENDKLILVYISKYSWIY